MDEAENEPEAPTQVTTDAHDRAASARNRNDTPRCALEAAIDRWGATVLRLATSRLGNTSDAEDVFQTVFLRLFQSHVQFADDEHMKSWLLRVTINCCNDAHRSPWKRHRATLDESVTSTLAATPERHEDAVDEELSRALAHLSEKQRTAIHLFYFEGYSTDEIAQITGELSATVRSHLHRARKTLKHELGVSL
ncbi:RNA polymerase sigma factor [Eggerthella sp. YY7918]|uniref:RNA polymerase sigma factor n=1 Tax=Eggerthella sp. (strain YY7918) TaxID=502558 RepID=UPI00021716AD|nr:sigma-70 family RNA polymerase sigma factor [Eggerthella sp. YY7918]BAK45015.1 hypothetical protein EGYY_18850 [Eggerthella sp. YY7918]